MKNEYRRFRKKILLHAFAVFVLASAVLAYALPSAIGGNGYLSAYLMGILLGNSPLPNKKTLVNFFDGLTSLMQMLIFFILDCSPSLPGSPPCGFRLLPSPHS